MRISDSPLDQSLTDSSPTATILVVDDSEEARRAATDVLELEGFHTVSAADGESGLALVEEHHPDLVLLDVMMPGLTGTEVLQAIRANPDTAETPVILITAMDQPEDVVNGLELGANDYLIKPPQAEILVARVRTQLKLKRLQDQRRRDLAQMAELDAIKDRFLQIAAHDLNNPINNFKFSLDLLDEAKEQITGVVPEFPGILTVMQVSAHTMQLIVSNFLDRHIIRSGQMHLDMQPVSLNQVIEETIAQFGPTAYHKQIIMSTDYDSKLRNIQADSSRLMQIMSNLIGNALKFTHSGGRVTIRTRAGQGVQRVEVEDTGPGIPPDEMPLLFQEFARLRNKPTGDERSSGLGLSIARQLVELHGGHIGAESVVGKGSTFWFELPAGRPRGSRGRRS